MENKEAFHVTLLLRKLWEEIILCLQSQVNVESKDGSLSISCCTHDFRIMATFPDFSNAIQKECSWFFSCYKPDLLKSASLSLSPVQFSGRWAERSCLSCPANIAPTYLCQGMPSSATSGAGELMLVHWNIIHSLGNLFSQSFLRNENVHSTKKSDCEVVTEESCDESPSYCWMWTYQLIK